MATLGLDYSYDWKNVNLDTVKSLGYQFVMRYVCYSAINNAGNDTSKKRLFPSEVSAITSRSLLLGLNWEYEAGDQRGGATKGQAHATEAVIQARTLGYPEGCAIYFSTDFNDSSAQPAIDAYMTEAKRVVNAAGFLCGHYGGFRVITRSLSLGTTDVGWQTYAWSLASQNTWNSNAVTVNLRGQNFYFDRRAAIRQVHNGQTVAGGNVDIDELHNEPFLWTYC